MSEYNILYIAIGSLAALVVSALLYGLAGRNNKALRRFGTSFVITLQVCVVALLFGKFSFWLLLLYPLKFLEFVQGYSRERGMPGWLKRMFIALTSLVSGAFLCWVFGGAWWLLIPHAVASLSTIFFSFKNPIAAAAEEPLVCCLNNLVVVFYPFVA